MTRRIVLHIDRLVLRGLERRDGAGIAAELQTELQRLLQEPGAVDTMVRSGAKTPPGPGTLRQQSGYGAATLGRAIARRIVRGPQR